MKLNRYEGRINDRCRLVLVNDEVLLYPFDQANWGFCGTGPAKVAEAILVNEWGRDTAQSLINAFKEQVVARWAGREGWVLTSEEIQAWKERT
jgi:hypothetical protein